MPRALPLSPKAWVSKPLSACKLAAIPAACSFVQPLSMRTFMANFSLPRVPVIALLAYSPALLLACCADFVTSVKTVPFLTELLTLS